MNKELEHQYDNYFKMFRTAGWKQFIEDIEDIYDAYRIEDISDDLQLSLVKGERRILYHIINFEKSIRANHDVMLEGVDDD